MGAWNINNISADLIRNLADLSNGNNNRFAVSKSAGFSSDYAKILSQKISEMEQEAQTEIENLSNQNEISVDSKMEVIETVRRFRPDGSIMITTYKDGKIDSRTFIKPHLVPMPDFSAPPEPTTGEPQIKMVQKFSVAELLML